MKRTIRVGIVQQACTNDLKLNLEKLHRNMNLWFAGFFPASDPEYTVVVLQDGQTGPEHSSAAIFAQVCQALWLLQQ